MPANQRNLGLGLVAAGVVAAGAFATQAVLVRKRRTRHVDHAVRGSYPRVRQRDPRVRRVVEALGHSGKWWAQAPVATMIAGRLWRAGHRRAAAAIGIASAAGALVTKVFDATIFRQAPPPEHPDPRTKSYPSGHALELAALSLTAGYVLMREKIAPASIAIPLAVAVPVASAGGRMYLDRHWASDVVGGWLAGAAIAAWCAATYELVPERDLARLEKRARRGAVEAARRIEQVMTRTVERGADTGAAVAKRSRRGLLGMGERLVAGIGASRELERQPLRDDEADERYY